jgi:hypothetical protein
MLAVWSCKAWRTGATGGLGLSDTAKANVGHLYSWVLVLISLTQDSCWEAAIAVPCFCGVSWVACKGLDVLNIPCKTKQIDSSGLCRCRNDAQCNARL